MSSTNHHDDRIEVLSVCDDAPGGAGSSSRRGVPPPSEQPINFSPADRPSGLQRNGSARGHR